MKRNHRLAAVAALTLSALVAGTGAGFAATPAPAAAPAFHGELPAPTGPYAVGEEVIHLTDENRMDPWVPSSGPRQLAVTMVYPAAAGTGTPAPYMTLGEAAGIIERQPVLTRAGVTPENLAAVTTHAFDGARPQHGKHPLVVLSAAAENPRMMLTSLATDLASHGYVVALVGHTYEDSGETLADGQTAPCVVCDHPDTTDFDAETAGRAKDVSFVIDQLTHGNAAWRLAHLINKHEIGMAGHSLGGAAAAATMIADPRVGAGVDMDGTFFPVPTPGQINRPFLMLGRADGHAPGSGGDDAVWKQAWDAFGGYKKWLTVTGANHFSFADQNLLQKQAGFPSASPLSPERGMEITREYVTAFFDRTLKGIDSPLMDGPSPDNPEVTFQQP
ncbi:alpha/beta hydrolase family protein [Kitasatospora sp. NPDC101183]|uniref:alpha/beta hydrolase family protein n=1 Tax=Kitasatospora sp. NPDC101183 TaxID=3364100 RepID=UPI003810BA3D